MYPHQVLMEEQGLTRNDLSPEAKGYLTDFNHQYRGIDLKRGRAEKAGKEFVLSPEDDSKLQRFSKSVCVQIYSDMNITLQEAKLKKEREEAVKREAEELKNKQQEEERLREEQIQQKKQEDLREEKRKLLEEERLREETRKKVEAEENSGNIFDYFF